MNTNLFLLTIIATNWMPMSGDWKRENGTNYVRQHQVISTNTFVVETRICYTSNLVHQISATNGVIRWLPVGVNAVPPLPGVMQKQ